MPVQVEHKVKQEPGGKHAGKLSRTKQALGGLALRANTRGVS